MNTLKLYQLLLSQIVITKTYKARSLKPKTIET